MNRILPILVFFLCVLSLKAQQEVQFTQFMHNKLVLNPAYAGASANPEITALYRNQWMGFEGNPQTALLSFNGDLVKDKVGIGLSVANYQIGLFNSYQGFMAYSYNISFNEKTNLRLGLQVSAKQNQIDYSDPTLQENFALPLVFDVNDEFFNNSLGMAGDVNDFNANFGAGAFLSFGDAYVGLSVPNLYNSEIVINEAPDGSRFTLEETQHFYGMAGVTFPVSNTVKLQPQILAKYVQNTPFDMDINLTAIFNDIVSTGVSYRTGGQDSGESVDFLLFFRVGNLGIGAAYDFTLTDIQDFSTGSLEALVKYEFGKKEASNLENPRFFE